MQRAHRRPYGRRMTTETHPALGASDAAATTKPLVIWIAVSAAAMVLGGLGPWADIADIATVNGTDADGWFIIVGGLLAAALALPVLLKGTARRSLLIAAGVGALATLIAAIDLADVEGLADGAVFGLTVETGWGLYLALAGSLSIAIASFVAWRKTR